MTDDELTGALFEAIADEIEACRKAYGSAWTDEWDKHLVARWEDLGGTLAAVTLARDLVCAEIQAADGRLGPHGVLSASPHGQSRVVVAPTWDAHHWFLERRGQYDDAQWATLVARPDWTDHAREDLLAERVCDWCAGQVARGNGTGPKPSGWPA